MDKDEIFEKEATYVSPITVEIRQIQRNYNRKLDTLIINEIRKYDVKVDKDELIKALKYDRNQYEKGYADGRKEAVREILQEFLKEFVVYASVGNYYTTTEIYDKVQELAIENGIELGENL